YLAVVVVYKGLTHFDNAQQPQQNPLAIDTSSGEQRRVMAQEQTEEEIKKSFPQPRLEEDERRELREFREPQDQQLDSYGELAGQPGVVHIPIERAIQLIVEKGLPTRPQAGVTPSSEVNTVKQAAQKADTSNTSKKGRKK